MNPQPKHIRRRDPAYLEFVRTQPCIVSGETVDIDAHHVPEPGHGAIGLKPDDRLAVPLRRVYHMEYHNIGRFAFELKYGVNLDSEIERLQKLYRPGRVKRARQPSSILQHIAIRCECGTVHKVKQADYVWTDQGVNFYCRTIKDWRFARKRIA